MRVLSLFTGIGGIDLGLERAGFTIAYHSEIDPYCQKVLRKHWPDVPNLGDVKNIKWEELDHVDVIAGGYPCQPFSTAGKRQGEEDPRHLWPYVRDAIRVLRPRYALMENVRGHLTLGFGSVLADLASLGYSAEWQVLPASAFGAPHRRDRLFFVAYPNSSNTTNGGQRANIQGQDQNRGNDRGRGGGNSGEVCVGSSGQDSSDMAYPSFVGGDGRELGQRPTQSGASGAFREQVRRIGSTMADPESVSESSTEPHRLPEIFGQASESRESDRSTRSLGDWWEDEPDVGRVAYGIPARVDRLRALGNAVVPQVAEWVGRRIMDHARLVS